MNNITNWEQLLSRVESFITNAVNQINAGQATAYRTPGDVLTMYFTITIDGVKRETSDRELTGLLAITQLCHAYTNHARTCWQMTRRFDPYEYDDVFAFDAWEIFIYNHDDFPKNEIWEQLDWDAVLRCMDTQQRQAEILDTQLRYFDWDSWHNRGEVLDWDNWDNDNKGEKSCE